MAFSLEKIFTTRTALPKNGGVVEIEPPAALKPYVRCFWTCERNSYAMPTRIIPDCCADIIVNIDDNSAGFVGLCFDSFCAENASKVFGIRFYAWAVSRFIHISAAELIGLDTNPENIFNGFTEFKDSIIAAKNTATRVEISEKYLLGLIDERYDSDVMNSLYSVIVNNGNTSVRGLSDSVAVSRRTLERKFLQNIGVSPKAVIELIRYQLLWQNCMQSSFCALDGVNKFGYYDQAHLYNDFKKYHGIGLSDARREYFKLSHFYNTIA